MDFAFKGYDGEDVIIEGYANKAVVDDAGDYIAPKAWDLVRYSKNPIVFFNHNPDYPIGKCDYVEQKDDGLYAKIRIAKSNHEKISYVRDLVTEGILKTFSVGFESKEMSRSRKAEGDDYNVIKKAKLHEISIVSLPMNEDSIFSQKIWSKKMSEWSSYTQAKRDVLQAKGAWVAAAIHESVYEAQDEGANKKELYAKIMEKAGIDEPTLIKVLAGEMTPVPENILEAIALVLGLSYPTLVNLNKGDAELEPKQPMTEEAKPMCKEESLAPQSDMSQEMLHEIQQKRSAKYGIEILKEGSSLTFPADMPTNLDDYADPVNLKYPINDIEHANNARARFKQAAGEYSADSSKAAIHARIVAKQLALGANPSFDANDPLDSMLPQAIKEQLMKKPEEKPAEKEMSPLEKCVSEKIPKLIAEGKDQEQAVAIAMSMCAEKGACSPDMIQKFLKMADQAAVPMAPTPAADEFNTGNPHLDLMKQQIVLLGVIADAIKNLSDKLTAGQPAAPKVEEQPPEQMQPAAKVANLDLLKKAFDNIDQAFSKLGF